MQQLRMVHLATLTNQFQARLLAARLGADGVLWQLRGECSIYPVGSVELFVDAEDLQMAQELLLVADLESAFPSEEDSIQDPKMPPNTPHHPWQGWALMAAVLVLIVLLSARPLLWH